MYFGSSVREWSLQWRKTKLSKWTDGTGSVRESVFTEWPRDEVRKKPREKTSSVTGLEGSVFMTGWGGQCDWTQERRSPSSKKWHWSRGQSRITKALTYPAEKVGFLFWEWRETVGGFGTGVWQSYLHFKGQPLGYVGITQESCGVMRQPWWGGIKEMGIGSRWSSLGENRVVTSAALFPPTLKSL